MFTQERSLVPQPVSPRYPHVNRLNKPVSEERTPLLSEERPSKSLRGQKKRSAIRDHRRLGTNTLSPSTFQPRHRGKHPRARKKTLATREPVSFRHLQGLPHDIRIPRATVEPGFRVLTHQPHTVLHRLAVSRAPSLSFRRPARPTPKNPEQIISFMLHDSKLVPNAREAMTGILQHISPLFCFAFFRFKL